MDMPRCSPLWLECAKAVVKPHDFPQKTVSLSDAGTVSEEELGEFKAEGPFFSGIKFVFKAERAILNPDSDPSVQVELALFQSSHFSRYSTTPFEV